MNQPLQIDTLEAAVTHVMENIRGEIVLGIPLGVGKPNPFVNALYRRVKADATRSLRIITALSLEKPVGHSPIEKSFLAPLVERVFKDYPDLDYVKDLRAGNMPPNIEICEFFMKTGDYLGNTAAQLSYISTNYTFVARDMAVRGMNVMAQTVATCQKQGETCLSLSSNPDLTFEVMEKMRAAGQPLMTIGVVNHATPFMPNGAEVAGDFFDVLVTDPQCTHAIFAPPNGRVSPADYAIGLHASSLVEDGGTLQIGIGSLGDAIGQALMVRERHSAEYRKILESLATDGLAGRELGRFEEGLYGCSEMFVNAFLKLIDAGILRREVYADAALQVLRNAGRIPDDLVSGDTLAGLLESGRIRSPLQEQDVNFLKKFGVFKPDVTLQGAQLVCGEAHCSNQIQDSKTMEAVVNHMLGVRLRGGIFMTGGFFLGPNDFYERLRTMPVQQLDKIDMTRIDFINQLYGDDALKRAQRIKARFINTTMKVTLLGAAASDALESGQVVSGVGGQYNFVAMSHALPDARLIMMLRATHNNKDGFRSNIVWNYGHVTIPRHLRDVVITEYGIAELRGQSDSEVVKRLIAIADSRFQDGLIQQAKAHGKLEAGYVLPERYRHNLPDVLAQRIQPWTQAGLLPDFPFGTDLTGDEQHMVGAMKRIKELTLHPVDMIGVAARSLWQGKQVESAYAERLGLNRGQTLKDKLVRSLFAANL